MLQTKGVWFGVGFGFFGDPVIQPGLKWLNTNYPNWQKLLELRNGLLKGVPTNAQLTVTLLRVGEANKAPIPPPPTKDEAPPDHPAEVRPQAIHSFHVTTTELSFQVTDAHLRAVGSDWPLNATNEELATAMENDPDTKHETAGADIDASKSKSHGKKGHRILSALKGSIKGSIETTLGADHLKAKVGSAHSKQRLGVIPRDPKDHLSGPVDFHCRFKGKKGHAYISTKATIPCVSFSMDKGISADTVNSKTNEELNPIWTVAVADIQELKKIGGLGWKAKLVVGWALDREVADGLEIVDKRGNTYHLTAMVLRDELFNRLVAMGGQKWEAW